MRDYEIVYIFRSNFTPEEIEAKLERFHAIITDASGEISAVAQWGKRQLAYPIENQTNGYYVVAQFTVGPDALAELERILKLEEDLLRFLIVLSEGELPLPEMAGAEATSSHEEDEEDDEDEGDDDEDDDDEGDDDEDEEDEGDDDEGEEDEDDDDEGEEDEDDDDEDEEDEDDDDEDDDGDAADDADEKEG